MPTLPEPERPWGTPRPLISDQQKRMLIFVALIAGGALLVWELAALFPHSASDIENANFISMSGFALLVTSSLLFGRRIGLGQAARYIGIWMGIAAVLVLGYAYQGELAGVYARVRSETVPSSPTVIAPHTMVLTADTSGGFFVTGEVNGLPVRFLVDTGASDIVLSPEDAKRLGVELSELQFTREYQTANGVGRGALFTVAKLGVGPVTLTHVAVSINQAPMDSSLLGMAFLKQLESFEVRDRKLYLKWRGEK